MASEILCVSLVAVTYRSSDESGNGIKCALHSELVVCANLSLDAEPLSVAQSSGSAFFYIDFYGRNPAATVL